MKGIGGEYRVRTAFTAFFTAFDLGADDLAKRDLASTKTGDGHKTMLPGEAGG